MESNSDLEHALHYAAARRPAWYVRHRRTLLIAVVSIVAVSALRYVAAPVWRRVDVLYLQRQALRCTPSGDHWVSRSDLAAGKSLRTHQSVYDEPAAWRRYVDAAGMGAWPVLYLGNRISPSGHERIVVARVAGSFSFASNINSPPDSNFIGMLAQAVSPGALMRLPSMPHPVTTGLGICVAPRPTVRIFAGQADPADTSHFTLVYEVGTQRGTVDGYLQDDDTIRLQVRDGPASASGIIDVVH